MKPYTFAASIITVLTIAAFTTPTRLPSQQPATQQVAVHDPELNNMVAWTGTIPAGWRFEGHILREGPGTSGQVIIHFTSPDGLTNYQSYPALVTTDLPAFQGSSITCPKIGTVEILNRYVQPHLFPNAKNVNEPTRNPAQNQPDGSAFDVNIISLHEDHNGRTFTTGVLGATVSVPRPGGHYFALTQITAFSSPTGTEHKTFDTLVPLKHDVSQQWLQADHQHTMAYFQAKSSSIAANGNAAILAEADRQRTSQDALFNASMTSAANSDYARHVGAINTAARMGDKTNYYVWQNTATGARATTTTGYPPVGGNWTPVQQ